MTRGHFRDRTGEVFGRLTIVKELCRNKVIARCSCNGATYIYNKASIVGGRTKSCGC